MKSMPQMPKIPSSDDSSTREDSFSTPFPEDSEVKLSESEVELDAPSHVENFKKPMLNSVESNDVSHIAAPQVPKQGIEVVAQRKAFYNQMRLKEGDKFFIKSHENFGEWMKCVDPYWEKKRIEFYKNKKAKK